MFTSPPIVQIILDSWAFLQSSDRLVIYAYVIMVNHPHLIAAAEDLSKEMASLKSYTARQIIDYLVEKDARRVLEQLAFFKLKHKKDREYQLW